jgi:hypothetical protein
MAKLILHSLSAKKVRTLVLKEGSFSAMEVLPKIYSTMDMNQHK